MDLKINSEGEEIDYFTEQLLGYLGRNLPNQICFICIVLFGIEFTITKRYL